MNEKEREEQLQAFLEHNPLDDDMLYLKSYVREHPDNKMGWYLLGKEYEVRNKPGKARYCFAQSGEVYEAFEKHKVKLGFMGELQADRTVLPGQKSRRRKLFRTLRLTAALLAAALLGSFFPFTGGGDGGVSVIPDGNADTKGTGQTSVSGPSDAQPRILYANPLEPDKENELWKELLLPGAGSGASALLVEGKLTPDGKWVNGLRVPEPLASGIREGSGVRIAYHKAELCNCKPESGESVQRAVETWSADREDSAILASAVRAYLSMYGEKLPDGLDGLIRDYPRNILPGYTEGMKKKYADLAAGLSAGTGTGANSSLTPAAGGKQDSGGYLEAPLEIIVDKSSFRLALVSGNVILRNYPVGLGGSKTPEGVFTVSEKVKHPNGKDDGDFGSRGMQLSDTDYAIHGTKDPGSIGDNRSLGCIRMLKEDIEELYDMTPSGTKVTIGTGLLPTDILRKEKPFKMPALREETNPNKTYHWLD